MTTWAEPLAAALDGRDPNHRELVGGEMAYIVELKDECETSGCHGRAVVRVRDCWNGTVGVYCRPHGKRELKLQEERER